MAKVVLKGKIIALNILTENNKNNQAKCLTQKIKEYPINQKVIG